jgi:hypothetical protein
LARGLARAGVLAPIIARTAVGSCTWTPAAVHTATA